MKSHAGGKKILNFKSTQEVQKDGKVTRHGY